MDPTPDDSLIRRLVARATASAAAILAPDKETLTYGNLLRLIEMTAATLAGGGVGPGDVVAIVLPNGPELGAAFLAIGSCAIAAPLNPQCSANEYEFYFSDLKPRCLVVESDLQTAAREIAVRLGIPVVDLRASARIAGWFDLMMSVSKVEGANRFNTGTDLALVLHTSGTTSRPKAVPLTSANLCVSADNIRRTLSLTEADRCLNVMPLFHIHGLVASVLSSISAGASVVCSPSFNALSFFPLMKAFRPTWYTAVPTMHQAILNRAERNRGTIAAVPLRFIRSSSAALPKPVLVQLELAFGCPAVEAYGMTEAAHQIASNPLPPKIRKPGSVGIAAGPDIAVMDVHGALLSSGEIGEIVIRGTGVTLGYLNHPAANARSFVNGWFRTGDQGFVDEDGYLTINGRLKEIINRGGEKISPQEIDEVLLRHPAVEQAVTFALPHDMLGEEVAAAVVVKEGASATEPELRAFVRDKVAAFKVPRKIVFLSEIPKGPTGKLQRIGLAKQLGFSD